MHEDVVDQEHGGRVDRVRLGRIAIASGCGTVCASFSVMARYAIRPDKKKGRHAGRPLRWEVLLGKF